MAKARYHSISGDNGGVVEKAVVAFVYPGCGHEHSVPIVISQFYIYCWGFNGNLEKPTITPSILRYETPGNPRCHSFVTDGKIAFCSDSTHSMAGQTIELPEIE